MAKKNSKLTNWVTNGKIPVTSEKHDDENIDDTDWPEVEDPIKIMRIEMAKEKSRRSKISFMCKGIIDEMVNSVEARSEVNKIVDMVLDRSVWRIRIFEVWSLLEEDKNLQAVVMKKILRQEKEKREEMEAMARDERIGRRVVAKRKWWARQTEKEMVNLEEMMTCLTVCSREPEKHVQVVEMEWSETELVEHVLLDRWMKELGIEDNMEDQLLGVDFDKEMRYLEGVLANNEARDSFKNDDKNITSNQDWVMPDTGGDQLVEGPEDHDQLRVNTVAYHSLGTWFLNNWVLSTAPGRIHEVDMSPECGEKPK